MMTLNIKSGYFFKPYVIIMSYFMLLFSLIATMISPLAIIFVAIFSFNCFTKAGVEIDLRKRQLRNYITIFFIYKYGRWKSLNKFQYITILTRKPPQIKTDKYTKYDITLLNKSHLKQFRIKRTNTLDEAKEDLDYLASELGLEKTKYKPKGGIYSKNNPLTNPRLRRR